jgi:hypothetical protein
LPLADDIATRTSLPEVGQSVPQPKVQAVRRGIHEEVKRLNRHTYLLATGLWVLVVATCGYFMLRGPSLAGGVNNASITLSKFQKLRTGMTYRECVDALGSTGSQQDLTYIRESGLTLTTYLWQNPDGSNIMAEFENGRLTTKVQAGLHRPQRAVQ